MAAAARAWSRWLPQSLFGRLVLVLAGGLLVAQLLSAAINLAERDRLVLAYGGMQQVQRIADTVQLLDALGPQERERVVAVLSVPPLVLSLHAAPAPAPPAADEERIGAMGTMAEAMLRARLGGDRALRITRSAAPDLEWSPMGPYGRGPGMMGGSPPGPGFGRQGRGSGFWHGGTVMRTEVQLRDGQWARFDAEAPQATAALPWRLGLTLLVLAAAVLALSYVAVRWVTRPLHVLAQAADELGRDLHRPPLPEDGPVEIRQAARAFNAMQARLARFVSDRTRVLAAMSHDLKTPLTRMRLRAELLDDDELRQHFEADLTEMQAMVQDTLDFMRGVGGGEPRQAVDVGALLESLQSDQQALGRTMTIEGAPAQPIVAVPSLLKRCLANLIDNAVIYGGQARVKVDDAPACLTLHVVDAGPGIPPHELEKVFEPFHRLEASRSRATGGTGLGLTIARNIAQSHGGDIVLSNRPEGGLDATLTLPRQPLSRPPRAARAGSAPAPAPGTPPA
jgi:signal transduction histidine kinase